MELAGRHQQRHFARIVLDKSRRVRSLCCETGVSVLSWAHPLREVIEIKPKMVKKVLQAVVHWTRDDKIGVEKLTSVPRDKRFVGSLTPIMFSGDKKFYPAKIMFISGEYGAKYFY